MSAEAQIGKRAQPVLDAKRFIWGHGRSLRVRGLRWFVFRKFCLVEFSVQSLAWQ